MWRPSTSIASWMGRHFGSGKGKDNTVKQLPAASDILYRNPEAIANRIQLYHMLKLQVQERIDRPALQST